MEKQIDLAMEKEIEQQCDDFFAIYDQLESLNHNDHVTILEENGQFVPADKTKVSHALAVFVASHSQSMFVYNLLLQIDAIESK